MPVPNKALPKSLQKINAAAESIRTNMSHSSDITGPKTDSDFAVNEVPYANLQSLYTDLLERYRKVSDQRDEITSREKRRQEVFLQKELKYREKLGSLEERIQRATVDDPNSDQRMNNISSMHGMIQKRIGDIQQQTTKVLQEQERDLIRAFRARLLDVTNELEKERKKNESGSVEWVAKCRKLTEELEWFRENTDKLTAENKQVLKENRRFKRQLKTQEEDREFLVKQLVSVKKENARLRYSFEKANFSEQEQQRIGLASAGGNSTDQLLLSSSMKSNSNSNSMNDLHRGRSPFSQTAPLGRPGSRGGLGMNNNSRPGSASRPQTAKSLIPTQMTTEQEARYKNMISKLQRQLKDEQKKLRNITTTYTREVSNRSELQGFLKKCIEDVRLDISQRHKHTRKSRGLPPANPPMDPRSIPLEEFTPADRINVMEWLLSQDNVIYMLYEKMFPTTAN